MSSVRTVLVTGGLGYLGSRLTQYLSEHGFNCIVADTGFFQNCSLYPPGPTTTILKDARQLNKDDLKGVDALVHLAGMSNDPFGNLSAEQVYDPTRLYALHVAKMCKEMGIRFIFPSSCSVYGVGTDTFLTEEGETSPQTPYSLNKLQVEVDLKDISDETFCPIILRVATVYGPSPRMRFDLVVNMLAAMAFTTQRIILNSDGKAWRPHVYIDDVAKAIQRCIDLEYHSPEPLILNVGDSSQNIQIAAIAEIVQSHVPESEIVFLQKLESNASGQELELVRDRKIQDGVDKRTYKVSFERIKKVLPGFQCDWTVQRAIPTMLDVFRQIGLTEEQFKSVDFYRLQHLESLLQQGHLSQELYWNRRIQT